MSALRGCKLQKDCSLQPFEMAKRRICQVLTDFYNKNQFLLDCGILTAEETQYFKNISPYMDEYDTPMQEAYVEDGTVLFLIVKADLDDMMYCWNLCKKKMMESLLKKNRY